MTRLTKEMPFKFPGCFIAGGAILSLVTKQPIADYDVYPKNSQGLSNALAELMHDHSSFVVNMSDRAITFKVNDVTDREGNRMIVQIMIFDWFETAEKIFEFFDFTVCMAAFECDQNDYVFHSEFYPDVASKTLRFNPKTRYPLASLIRTSKYRTKGYQIGKFEFAKIAIAVANSGVPKSWEELEASLGGVYGRQISLNTQDVPYSYENALDILSTLEFDPDEYLLSTGADINKYRDLQCDDITNYFLESELEYITVNDHINCFLDGFFVGERFSAQLTDLAGPRQFKQKTPSRLFGYVCSGYSTERCSYEIGDVFKSSWTHITRILRKKEMLAKKNSKHFYLVSFDTKDISNVTYDEIFISGGARVELEVSLETPDTSDVHTALDQLIVT